MVDGDTLDGAGVQASDTMILGTTTPTMPAIGVDTTADITAATGAGAILATAMAITEDTPIGSTPTTITATPTATAVGALPTPTIEVAHARLPTEPTEILGIAIKG